MCRKSFFPEVAVMTGRMGGLGIMVHPLFRKVPVGAVREPPLQRRFIVYG